MICPVLYRGIAIRSFDIPCTPFVWVHDESVSRHLGPRGGDVPCPECCGYAALDWSHLAIEHCPWCTPEKEEAA